MQIILKRLVNKFKSFTDNIAISILKNSRTTFIIKLNEKYKEPFNVQNIDYQNYLNNQKIKTKTYLKNHSYKKSWTNENTIKIAANYIKNSTKKVSYTGICHGCRFGNEVLWFKKYLSSNKIIGTDIEPDASKFDDVITWDFHKIKKEWIEKFDFIYTNSHDHALLPKKAINNWISSLKKDGLLLLEHSRSHGKLYSDLIDVWAIETELLPFAILDLSKGKYFIKEMIKLENYSTNYHCIFVIKKNS